ncbi:Protein of unknown function [Alteromonadaceae bacterium Bs31]|nr:Protein of unknown function [Alteromonadaceae bacterium Bs31]
MAPAIIEWISATLIVVGILYTPALRARQRWTELRCKIVGSRLDIEQKEYIAINCNTAYEPVSRYSKSSYSAKVCYAYKIHGKGYLSANIKAVSFLFTSPSEILPFTDGSTQKVWVNPKKPEQSYIIRPTIFPVILIITSGIVALFWQEIWLFLLSVYGHTPNIL